MHYTATMLLNQHGSNKHSISQIQSMSPAHFGELIRTCYLADQSDQVCYCRKNIRIRVGNYWFTPHALSQYWKLMHFSSIMFKYQVALLNLIHFSGLWTLHYSTAVCRGEKIGRQKNLPLYTLHFYLDSLWVSEVSSLIQLITISYTAIEWAPVYFTDISV